jgi:hypothetical protein
MERFHIIVLVVASVSLILVLTVAGILIKKDNSSQKFPTSHKDVPDGWTKSENKDTAGVITGYTLTHTTTGGANTNPTTLVPYKTFTGAVWKDIDICEKKKWADQNEVYWDGITTYNGC